MKPGAKPIALRNAANAAGGIASQLPSAGRGKETGAYDPSGAASQRTHIKNRRTA